LPHAPGACARFWMQPEKRQPEKRQPGREVEGASQEELRRICDPELRMHTALCRGMPGGTAG
jgi:hypothetical protein